MKCYGKSHIGLKRKQNQDSFCLIENGSMIMAIVCDGIGGGNAGEVASTLATAHMKASFLEVQEFTDEKSITDWLMKTIQESNDIIFSQSIKHEDQKGMGTTLVGVIQCIENSYVFNVGDSRTYGLYDDDFQCLTQDHSFIASLLKSGDLSEEEAKTHPNRNVLTNALGIWDHIKIDINKIKNAYRALLICSDGLHGYVHEQEIEATLRSEKSVEQKVDDLIQNALQAGGYDNVSVIILEKEKVHG